MLVDTLYRILDVVVQGNAIPKDQVVVDFILLDTMLTYVQNHRSFSITILLAVVFIDDFLPFQRERKISRLLLTKILNLLLHLLVFRRLSLSRLSSLNRHNWDLTSFFSKQGSIGNKNHHYALLIQQPPSTLSYCR
jgi:hypothetical protein